MNNAMTVIKTMETVAPPLVTSSPVILAAVHPALAFPTLRNIASAIIQAVPIILTTPFLSAATPSAHTKRSMEILLVLAMGIRSPLVKVTPPYLQALSVQEHLILVAETESQNLLRLAMMETRVAATVVRPLAW